MTTKRAKRSLATSVAATFLVALSSLGSSVHATVVVCQYDKNADAVNLEINTPPDIRLFVTSGDELRWKDLYSSTSGDCGTSTVHNTDSVTVLDNTAGGTRFVLDMRRLFAPGATQEGAGQRNEIEFTLDGGPSDDELEIWGGRRADVIIFGTEGIALNGDGDFDATHIGYEDYSAIGKRGPDFLSGDGGAGSGLTYSDQLSLYGNGGGDLMFGGDAADLLVGNGGDDRLNGLATNDIVFGDRGDDVLLGSSGPDEIDGLRGNDRLRGGGAVDDLDGGGGTDNCGGGPGADTLAWCENGPGD